MDISQNQDTINKDPTPLLKPRKKRKKKPNNKNKKNFNRSYQQNYHKNKKRPIIPMAMSAWAENFTQAATWQLKHQMAYWKSRATALEYENKILHDIIRQNCLKQEGNDESDGESNMDHDQLPQEDNCNDSEEVNDYDEGNEEEDSSENELEPSEEFIEFLRKNAKYREEARLEKERLKLESEAEDKKRMEAIKPKPAEDKEVKLKRLYGDSWQKIGALEMSMESHYINECDRLQPALWPEVPLNLKYYFQWARKF